MGVEFQRIPVRQEDTGVVIKLKDDDGTLNAIVKRITIAIATDPAEVGGLEVVLYLRFPNLPRYMREVQEKFFGDVKYELLLLVVHVRDEDPLIRYSTIVTEGPTKGALVVLVPSILDEVSRLQHARVMHLPEDLTLLLIHRGKTLHQSQSQLSLAMKDCRAKIWSFINNIWFRTSECGRNNDLTTAEKNIEA